jgi:hypothetical protein
VNIDSCATGEVVIEMTIQIILSLAAGCGDEDSGCRRRQWSGVALQRQTLSKPELGLRVYPELGPFFVSDKIYIIERYILMIFVVPKNIS